jgi:hypothetical protein
MIPLPEPVQVSELSLCAELLSTWIDTHHVALGIMGILALIGFFVALFGTLDRIDALVGRLWQHVRSKRQAARKETNATTKP